MPPEISLPSDALIDPRQVAAWNVILELADDLGDSWALVGGQMVMLHQIERSAERIPPSGLDALRMSIDVDVVVNIRAGRNQMPHVHQVATSHGFSQIMGEIAHRYRRPGSSVLLDVLAPESLGPNLPRLGKGRTLQAVGASQALKRIEPIKVRLGAASGTVYRPNLVGAIIMKGMVAERVGTGGPRQGRDLDDVALLATLLTHEDVRTASLKPKERALLRRLLPVVSTLSSISPSPGKGIAYLQELSARNPANGKDTLSPQI